MSKVCQQIFTKLSIMSENNNNTTTDNNNVFYPPPLDISGDLHFDFIDIPSSCIAAPSVISSEPSTVCSNKASHTIQNKNSCSSCKKLVQLYLVNTLQHKRKRQPQQHHIQLQVSHQCSNSSKVISKSYSSSPKQKVYRQLI
ncbi:hypothetical protein DFA_06965 [Cavenderia fasciculata]|uniref:Uncharacterized protein n=1 Tax=Cavenderia fasciculata TaxID=261658 RepID=F4PX59_CACFS|nr:uncharacterized protein DFA_06965 [Cavenderia fasciculata]EGG19862.1 hypothetical protein DFA_06965 [Cavenderia fasciculata]|eukprot:XP_004358208.1 hypothetical protein DFA_06965 [Cavenderia fasciculata]